MPYSRTRTHQKTRKRRFRKLVYVNLALLLAVVAAGGLLVYQWNNKDDGKLANALPTGSASASPATGADSSPGEPPSDSAQSGEEAAPSDEPSPSADASASAEPSASDVPSPADEPAASGEPAAGGGPTPAGGGGDDEAQDSGGKVKLAFVGDILPAARVGELIEKNGVDYPFAGSVQSLKSADITAGNLETPITNRGTPAENKTYVFRGKPEYLAGIKNAGFDVLSLANNHTLDQGWEGLSDTMDYLDDAGLKHMGSGADDKEAFTPVYIESKGIRVAYIGVTNVVPEASWKADKNHPGVAETYDTTRAVAAIKEAKQLADIVVVMVHWGKERSQNPIPVQTSVGHTFIDAGADLVVGSHPHVLQGFEYYKNKWIAYSLGNFIFTTSTNSITRQTGVLTASCGKNGSCALSFEPMYSTNSQPAPMEPTDGALLLSQLSERSFGAKIDELGNIVPSSSVSGKETP
ncbi:CapA family protein [Cohnella thermotolerans]|uniref:CapA family protein n=1 Tax=Cohnella thermotolerans TaxID=329858 RepID=UPI0003F66CDA|nr:CapA family protein [Cohnella thermotolerans]